MRNVAAQSELALAESSQALQNYLYPEEAVVELQLKIAAFITQHNLPLSITDSLINILKSCFPKDKTLQQMQIETEAKQYNSVR